jgi:hypothetical protein
VINNGFNETQQGSSLLVYENDPNTQHDLIESAYSKTLSLGRGVTIPDEILDKYRNVAKDGRRSLRNAIKDYYIRALNGQKIELAINNGAINVFFGNDGMKKTVGRRGLTPRKAATVEYLMQLVGNAIYAYSEENRKDDERKDVPRFHYFINNINIDDTDVLVKIIIRDLALSSGLESRYYTHDLVKK